MEIVRSALTALRLRLMRRRQFDNLKLRAYFGDRYGIEVGLYSYGCFDVWRMRGPMKVGRYCSIANTVRSALDNHPLEALTTHPALYEKHFGVVADDRVWGGHLEIEDDVWIGHNAVILPGCKRIGRGAVIGAGSIVTRDVDPYVVMAGNPARKLRCRFTPEIIEAIEASRWWEMSLAELRQLVRDRPDLVFAPGAEALRAWSAARSAA
jgi:virginiamycin A acetyltransferase